MDANYAELHVDGHRILPELLRDIEEAQHAIHVAMFLFFRDPIGEELARALARKAKQGVTVRVLMNVEKTHLGDPFSTGEKEMMEHDPHVEHDPTDVKPMFEWMREQGIQVHDTNIDYDHLPKTKSARLRSLGAQIRETIDVDDLHVDHRKIIVIDGRIAWCGGANVGAQYLFHHPFEPGRDAREEGETLAKQDHPEPWWKWHDSLTRFEGPIALPIDEHFRDRWILDGGDEFQPVKPTPGAHPPRGRRIALAEVLLNEPNDQPNEVREKYVELIRSAERSIFIENPYLYHPAIVGALLEAKRKRPELQVQLMLPARQWNDNEFAHDAQQHAYAEYLEGGIEVYEYQGHFNHLKIAVFDERWSIHGSTNLNFRSLEDDKDFELDVFVEDEGLAREVLREVRDVDVQYAKRYTEEDLATLRGRLRINTRDPRTVLLMSRRML